MRREASPVRKDFAEQAKRIGFAFSHIDGQPYWDESARYVFSLSEIEALERATLELGALFRDLAGRIVASEEMMARLGVPDFARDVVAASWRRHDRLSGGLRATGWAANRADRHGRYWAVGRKICRSLGPGHWKIVQALSLGMDVQ
jgi:hypothetical protein